MTQTLLGECLDPPEYPKFQRSYNVRGLLSSDQQKRLTMSKSTTRARQAKTAVRVVAEPTISMIILIIIPNLTQRGQS